MQCERKYNELIDKYFDGEATSEEKLELYRHTEKCEICREHVNQLRKAIAFVQSASHIEAPEDFTNKVMAKLPKKKTTSKWKGHLRKHPLLTAAAIFFLLMTASITSMWFENQEGISVSGPGNVIVDHETGQVIVPEGEIIHGDLTVKNGNLIVEGEVRGNVLLVNSEPYLASAGHVSGEISEVNKALEWVWYHIKTFFTEVVSITNNNNDYDG
ncbi:anti-sigma W factor [Alkalihalobacillus alcalophilus ATCC 27647 = CGMCC 1.3604]|uniref:Anti-sigma-W factor RsiW n=1 Tax=Alkalihalobacillus alcalophilus ATCC 27647 = CGMCC 1.3604 TaxID=1218173 RepID=A0A094YQS4_ALKAL|nr:anti-sigma factor [Alkalihalobacillus alcalophilus]KGA95787.1 anti-sigma W factor [Alkalihalobacillus alcalophilus ATCC 27647 = CGMCC 1.3604]MED1561188.1 anti-sigma factor [Alkalihalobacillus alcalophilus]THG91782.1 anti-sigma W factor [Alkalihalobacillus alcalophilus ATCC 27647 = CGMCC 1.3604]